MPCAPPITLSEGFAFLDYVTNGFLVPHRTRAALIAGYGPNELTIIGPEADNWAEVVAGVLPTNASVVGWGTMTADGSIYHQEPFAVPYVGGHAAATGAEDFKSRTITFTGKGLPGAPGVCGGQTRMVLFVGQAFNFIPGQTGIPHGFDIALDEVADFLNICAVFWADHYGQSAGVRPIFPVQYNAAAQRRIGS